MDLDANWAFGRQSNTRAKSTGTVDGMKAEVIKFRNLPSFHVEQHVFLDYGWVLMCVGLRLLFGLKLDFGRCRETFLRLK